MQRLNVVLLISGSLALHASPAHADGMPPVYVTGETDTKDMRACYVSYDQALEATKAAFRYNNVAIGSRDDYIHDRALRAYVNLNVLEETYTSGRSTGSCIVALNFKIATFSNLTNPVTGSAHFADIVFCERGSLMNWDKSGMAVQVKENLADSVNSCVSKYADSKR